MRILRRLSFVLGLALLCSVGVFAQGIGGKLDVSGGVSYMDFGASPSVNMAGWNFTGQYKFNDWFGGVADFSGNYGSGASVHTFLFGPQLSWPSRVSPFAHVLLGAAHFSESGVGDTSFSVAIGAGIDSKINDRFSWRIIEGDYVPTRFFGSTQNNARILTAVVVHF
ncbi:MAG TPA: outer membrane beta-barrel protein [Candidatus Acidoferrales bacterium]|nr:outer membrane beta-barrel protein [Candidatus Acidoferrales bacterium]